MNGESMLFSGSAEACTYLVKSILQFLENPWLAVLHVPLHGVLSANLEKLQIQNSIQYIRILVLIVICELLRSMEQGMYGSIVKHMQMQFP